MYSVCFEEHMPRPKVPHYVVTGLLGFMMGSEETLDRVKKKQQQSIGGKTNGSKPEDQN
ncbi:MAG: hypothetical protein IKX68_00255 [Clostridiales bacterium]|nr:hypothetical protein [Clostridiales bacterium]